MYSFHNADRDYHLLIGFISTKDSMLVLSDIGRNDVVYRSRQDSAYNRLIGTCCFYFDNSSKSAVSMPPSGTVRRRLPSVYCSGQ